jgi:putative SOS response-associated peptidase YedK
VIPVCGRFLLTYDIQAIKNYYGVSQDEDVMYAPMPEIFPSQTIPVITRTQRENHLEMMDWGFPNPYGKGLLINARGETAATKPTFRRPFSQHRCLIPADGFFEWKQEGKRKIKYRIRRRDGGLFSMAGLYRPMADANGIPQRSTCLIITTEPAPWIAEIHNRMPAILTREAEQLWLDEALKDPEFLTQLLVPFDPEGDLMMPEEA